MKLTIDLVPRNIWAKNLRTLLPKEKWDALRWATYRRVGFRCEICGGRGDKHPVECHEEWRYDDEHHIAELVGLYGLCPSCHEVKHLGLAQVNGNMERAIVHLARINEIPLSKATEMAEEAFRTWADRSKHTWRVVVKLENIDEHR